MKYMSKQKYLVVMLLVVSILYIIFNSNQSHYSTVTSGIVINKSHKDEYIITLKIIDRNKKNGWRTLDILVDNEMVWNLIEKDRTYFVKYFWVNNDTPVLDQIEINDDFKWENRF